MNYFIGLKFGFRSSLVWIASKIFNGAKLYQQKNVETLASSATFYAILSSIPLLLILIRLIGILLGDVKIIEEDFLLLLDQTFPQGSIFLKPFQNIFFRQKTIDLFSYSVLTFSSLAFFNAIWKGLHLVIYDYRPKLLKTHVKSFMAIVFTFIFLFTLLMIGPFFSSIVSLFQEFEVWPVLVSRWAQMIVRSYLLHAILFVSYFTFFYYWLLEKKIQIKDSFLGALTFSIIALLAKFAFWSYLFNLRKYLEVYYGDFYTLIAIILWLYILISSFFFGACVSYIGNQFRFSTKNVKTAVDF